MNGAPSGLHSFAASRLGVIADIGAADGQSQSAARTGSVTFETANPALTRWANEYRPTALVEIDPADGQSQSGDQTTGRSAGTRLAQSREVTFLKDLVRDQRDIYTSPFHMKPRHLLWVVPLAGLTAAGVYYDRDMMTHVSTSPDRIDTSRKIGDAGAYAIVGAAGGVYLLGKVARRDDWVETGLLGGESVLDSLLLVEIIKLASNRMRPDYAPAPGDFWVKGTSPIRDDPSFPSGHAAAGFALASAMSTRTRSPFLKVLLFSGATAISVSRVTARRHFPSDVFLGSGLGFIIGNYVGHARGDDRGMWSRVSPMVGRGGVGVSVRF